MNDDQLILRHGYRNVNTYGSVQHRSPTCPQNFRHFYLKPESLSNSSSSPEPQTTINVHHAPFISKKSARRLSAFTKLVVPYYSICFLFSIAGILVYYIMPFGETQKILFTVTIVSTILGAVVGCFCEYRWSAITQFRELLIWKNKQFKQSIDSLIATKRNLTHRVKKMEHSIERLGRSAADLERTLQQFNQLRAELQKLTNKSQHVSDVLDNLLQICDNLTELIREHAKTELMVAYYDAAVFASRDSHTICLQSHKWRNFRSRLDSKTRKVFDECGGFEAVPRYRNNQISIHDLEKVLSFVIDERGFDDIYCMFKAI